MAPNLDRLAHELVVQEAALVQCWKHGGRAFMADQGEILPDDPEAPMRTAMRRMMGVFAQLDRGMTVAKLQRGPVTCAIPPLEGVSPPNVRAGRYM
ncbi:recombinase family protein [Streptomyces sp. TP-A0356]|uniref:recombinase family protein n=1 Tax=Streptomyces sp. TP-A0356 TaxID=1359208 RepID=UPI0006E3F6C5|nr:recombinase family protein [Streptomyces sp. TP-A0356]